MSKAVIADNGKYKIDFLKSHTVYKNAAGKRLPGVTTVLGMLSKPALLRWAWDLGKSGIDMEASRQGAADIGTIAHALCEAHLREMELDTDNIAPEQLAKAQNGFRRFMEFWTKEQLVVIATELSMISERMQVGGTLDIVAMRPNGAFVLVDLKSSKGIYDEMLVQAATYAAMYEETTNGTIAEVFVVRIGKEDADDLEVRPVGQRVERVAAFAALAEARRLLQAAGVRV
ncbi:MAG: PD-(D/E)XK nuclease family protein [Methylocystis sp.]|uniref:PD-(D/E)XK nuclease family protein n=1 Tax=Methylocystis sp. TaxID=1911079 RepID=UPI003DA3BD3E